MPAGVGWGVYLRFTAAAMFSMFAGSQLVHSFYKPLDDMDIYIKAELKKCKEGTQTEPQDYQTT